MSNPIPRIGPDGTIRCMNHPERTAAALQCASITAWSDAASVIADSPLLVIAPVDDIEIPLMGTSHAIFWEHVKNYFSGNGALGMCSECAVKFWDAFGFPPLYINQHAIFSSHVTIARTTVQVDIEPHTFHMMRLETPTGLSNKIELVCPDCITKRYQKPHSISLKEYAYE